MADPPERAIFAALTGEEPEVKTLRTAVLRLFHAGERTQWFLDDLQANLRYFLDEPTQAVWDRVLSDEAVNGYNRLISLANEILKSSTEIDSIRAMWQKARDEK